MQLQTLFLRFYKPKSLILFDKERKQNLDLMYMKKFVLKKDIY